MPHAMLLRENLGGNLSRLLVRPDRLADTDFPAFTPTHGALQVLGVSPLTAAFKITAAISRASRSSKTVGHSRSIVAVAWTAASEGSPSCSRAWRKSRAISGKHPAASCS